MNSITTFVRQFLEPEELRHQHVAGHHDPVGPGIRAEGAIDEGEASYWTPEYHAMKNSVEYARPTIMPVASMILAMLSR
jgi:hypothetical protein